MIELSLAIANKIQIKEYLEAVCYRLFLKGVPVESARIMAIHGLRSQVGEVCNDWLFEKYGISITESQPEHCSESQTGT